MPQSLSNGLLPEPLSAPDLSKLEIIEFPIDYNDNASILPPLDTPKSLTIRFSRASDLDKVVALYTSPRKDQIDPQGFVRPRTHEELAQPVKNGAAALALDENGVIRASALTAHYSDGACGSKNITEIGAVMCDVGGVGLAKTLLAMLSLKQTFDPLANKRVYAKVARENEASNRVFSSSLGWTPIECPINADELYNVAYRKKAGQRDRVWYHFTGAAEIKAADVLKTCVEKEGLSGRGGKFIPLNIDASSFYSTLHYHDMLSREAV